VCYCTYKSSQIAFNDDPSRKSPAISISGSFGFRWVAFECALMPVAAATETHRSDGRAGFSEIRNPLFVKLLFPDQLQQGDI
jgi:hypothetical protein